MRSTKTILMILFTFNFINTGNLVLSSDDQGNDPSKTMFERIQQIAAKTEVFPVDIYNLNHSGPLGLKAVVSKDTSVDPRFRVFGGWQYRYDLTFDRFIPLFEFKECVYNASVNDLDDCINRIEEMTPKEKALLLTAIFIFEFRYRHCASFDEPLAFMMKLANDYIDELRDRYDPQMIKYFEDHVGELLFCGRNMGYKPNESIDKEVWSRWLTVIEKYRDDKTVVFPTSTVSTRLDTI